MEFLTALPLNNAAHLVVGLITFGLGMSIGISDWSNTRNRPMAGFLLILGLNLFLNSDTPGSGVGIRLLDISLNALAFLLGLEWSNRIGYASRSRMRIASSALNRLAQILILVFWLLGLIYVLRNTDPIADDTRLFTVNGLEIALFAPLLGSAMLLAVIAGILLRFTRMDRAEILRLRVLALAAPFLISGLVLHESITPFTMALGILIICAGAIQYLMIQGRRGQFMSQFLAPEVADLVRNEGMDRVMRRQQQIVSVVVCDLRGFTSYARVNDSNEVLDLLQRFYTAVGEAAAEYGGTIKDHAGDGVLLLVGAPVAFEDHSTKALQLAIDLMRRGKAVLTAGGLDGTVGLGVGVATGTVTIGTIKGAGQLEYVAVGNAVNLAARLCDRAAHGQILSDTRTADEANLPENILRQTEEPEPLKGFPEPISVCSIRQSGSTE